MNKLVIIIALTLLLKPVLPVAGYIINYDYIVKELCENKDNSALKCNGKCQLKKELANASSGTEGTNHERRIKVAEQEILYVTIIEEFLFTAITPFTSKIKDSYNNFYCFSDSTSIFRPPSLY